MKFLIDECLHTSLVAVVQGAGHDRSDGNWLGLSGETDWDLMPRIVAEDFMFVTNNARDFRELYAKEELHAGLVIIVPQVLPALQRELFALILQEIVVGQDFVLKYLSRAKTSLEAQSSTRELPVAHVVLTDLVKNYGSFKAVKNVSLTVNDGEFVALVGP